MCKKAILLIVLTAFNLSANSGNAQLGLFQKVKDALSSQGNKNIVLLSLGSFGLGVASSLTPCVYPIIPVTANIFAASGGASSFGATILGAGSYFAGIASVYAGAGFVAARTGTFFGRWFSNPFFLILAMILFLLMALYALGLLNLRWLNFGSGGQRGYFQSSNHSLGLVNKYFLGAVVGLTASPCVTPALAMLLSFAANTQTPFLGFLLLFCYSLGFCMILLLSGVFFSRAILYKPGRWMNLFKFFLAQVVAVYGIWFIEPLVPMFVLYVLSAGFILITSFLAKV